MDCFKSQSINDLRFFKVAFWRKMKKTANEIEKKAILEGINSSKKAADHQSAAFSFRLIKNYL